MGTRLKTGLAVATQIAKHLCHVLRKFRPAMDAAIDAAVTSTLITAGDAATLKVWLDGATTACDILRAVTGY